MGHLDGTSCDLVRPHLAWHRAVDKEIVMVQGPLCVRKQPGAQTLLSHVPLSGWNNVVLLSRESWTLETGHYRHKPDF